MFRPKGIYPALLTPFDDNQRVNEAEQEAYGDQDLPEVGEEAEIDSQRLTEKMAELNERLRKRPKDKGLKKAVRQLEKTPTARRLRNPNLKSHLRALVGGNIGGDIGARSRYPNYFIAVKYHAAIQNHL